MRSAVNREKEQRKKKQKRGSKKQEGLAADKEKNERMCVNALCVLNYFIFVFLQLYNDLYLSLG